MAGMFSTCASDPELRFLSTVVATGSPVIDDLRIVLADQRWSEIIPGIVLYDEPDSPVDEVLREAGYTVHGWRPVAVRKLTREDRTGSISHPSETLRVMPVADDGLDEFVTVLLTAYEVDGAIARFIESEHRSPQAQRFAVRSEDRMIAVAGMTHHGEIAVLGGAATLPAERGKGAQALLLRHRLRLARQAGCTEAVATAVHGSPSARNLGRSGFVVCNRPSRHKPG